jgi:hypothetical protein
MASRSGWERLVLAVSLVPLLSPLGCSTHYQPKSATRLSVVIEGGNYAYRRDGKTFSHGAFGAGLVDAVEDDPEAREAAETHHGHMVGGVVAYAAGLVCLVGGLTWALSNGDPNNANNANSENNELSSEQTAILIGSLGCWAAGLVTGTVLISVGQPYQWDAINIYNDNRDARARALPPLLPPAGIPLVPAPKPAPGSVPPPPPAAPPAEEPGETDDVNPSRE